MKNAKKVIRILSWCIFVVYLVALVYFLFFSEQLGRVPSDEYKYSLVPFEGNPQIHLLLACNRQLLCPVESSGKCCVFCSLWICAAGHFKKSA